MDDQKQQTKLPVIQILRDSFAVPFQNRQPLTKALALTGVLMFLLEFSASQGLLGTSLISSLVFLLSKVALFVLFAITCHRNILLPGKSTPTFGMLEWNRREWKYIGWAVIAYFYLYLMFAFAAFFSSSVGSFVPSMGGLSYTVIYMFIASSGMYFFARLSLLFPAVATDHKTGWDWVLDLTEGNGWRLVVIIGIFPIVLAVLPGLFANVHVAVDALLLLFSIVLLVVEITALSLSFRHLTASSDLDTENES